MRASVFDGRHDSRRLINSPKVSVLMACYNAEPFVGSAIESVLTQTMSDLELILVDDGSTDGSADVMKRYHDPRIRIFQTPNAGAAKARNAAYLASRGRFVLFLDADDLINSQHLEHLLARLDTAPSCVALSKWDRFRLSPSEALFPDRATETDCPGSDWLTLDWAAARPMTQSGMVMIPRDLIERNGAWDERLTLKDDFEFFARVISASDGVRFAPRARLYYRSGLQGSLSASRSPSAVQSELLSLMLGTQHLLAKADTPQTRRACANVLQDFDYAYFPNHAGLRARARARVAELGGARLEPDGPPNFHRLRRVVGWRNARIVQRALRR